MKRRNPVRIGQLIGDLKNINTLSNGMKEVFIMGAWEKVVGKNIADYTTKLYIRDRKLYVNFSSPAARQELFSRRREVIQKLNEIAGEYYITFISVF